MQPWHHICLGMWDCQHAGPNYTHTCFPEMRRQAVYEHVRWLSKNVAVQPHPVADDTERADAASAPLVQIRTTSFTPVLQIKHGS